MYRMLLAANGISPPEELDLLEKMGWGDWKLLDHETYKEDLLRSAPDFGLFPVSYYPGHYVLPKFDTGVDGADFIARNREIVNELEGFKYLKALLVKSRMPVYLRKHFDTPEYNMPEEMAETLDTCGHGMLVIGYNNQGFVVHDPWNKAEWGGSGGGRGRTLSYEALRNEPSVNCCLGFMGQILRPSAIISYPKYALIPNRDIEIDIEISMPGIKSICINSYTMKVQSITERLGKHHIDAANTEKLGNIELSSGDIKNISVPVKTIDRTGSYPIEFELKCLIEIPPFAWESRFKEKISKEISIIARRRLDIKSVDWINKYGR